MTVSTAYSGLSYAGNGSTTAFSVTWPFFTGTLVVTLVSSTGVETVKSLTTHYTVSGGTDANGLPATGTVTMLTAPASGETLRITRLTPKTQASTWAENDAFPQKTIEAALDKLTLIGQEGGNPGTINDGVAGDVMELVTSGVTDYWDAESKVIRNVADAVDSSDAVNYGQFQSLAVTAGAGDVVGPGSATDNVLVRFHSTTGKIIQTSVVSLSDAGVFTGVDSLTATGTLSAPTIFGTTGTFTGNVTAGTFIGPTFYGGSATGSSITLESTSNASPSGDYVRAKTGGSERWRVTSNGQFVLGHTASVSAPLAARVQAHDTTSSGSAISATRWSNDANGSALVLSKSRGAAVGTNAIVQSGDLLGTIIWGGDNGTGFDQAAQIAAFVNGTPGAAADMPGRLSFRASADGSATPSEALQLSATTALFPLVTTTATAANAVLDNGANNSLLRSTSSRRYKQNIETLDSVYAEKLLAARPVWYRSKSSADRADWSWYGLIAEELAEVDPRLVQYGYTPEDYEEVERDLIDKDGKHIKWKERVLKVGSVKVPDGVQYERLTVLLLSLVQRLWSKTVSPTPNAAGLAAVKARHLRMIDDDAEAVRLRFITPGGGQALTYQEKFAQAGAVQALGEAAANAMSEADRIAQFPTLAASVGIEAPTLWAAASLVLARYAAFATASYHIERARLSGKKAVSDAADEAGVRVAYGAITWPTP